ncbi:hypothetical protein ADL22_18225 [Streptomyces sp. NRRL F-4489]|uniref:hypothetical protein n=1 Tax=Streptomyces sp. NRRL F-4489 TaxID=1609095 RepID=UPI0007471124|nr:hypothetical protein [Streptomyces sp. NRRL F-4489]KUL38459.1 hypothetical protein ADL22_18225 [Streptomyces sp. NRRL F-4489]
MQAESAAEIVRASLALAFPTATDEGLTRAAEVVLRWGSEGVGEQLEPDLAERMLYDLMEVAQQDPQEFMAARAPRPDGTRVEPAASRAWSQTSATRDELPYVPRPPAGPRRRRFGGGRGFVSD